MYHFFHKDPDKWRPLLSVFYLTYACDFRCPYCCDGHGTPYYKLSSRTLSPKEISTLLRCVRKYCDFLVITGGEPLKHPEFAEAMQAASSIGFKGIVLTTNGYDVDGHIDTIAETTDYLVFSIDTLDHRKADTMFGRPAGTLKKILQNIEIASRRVKKRYEIIISSVVTPDNIEDLHEVRKFARQNHFRFAASPQLFGVKPHEQLFYNDAYKKFFDSLLDAKRKGHSVNGGILYLKHMRDLTRFTCRPSTVLAVSPQGDVFYPCLELGNIGGNLLEVPNLDRIRAKAKQLFGPEPSCDNRCHSACALGLSLILNDPSSLLSDAYYLLKSKR
jgi:MoaA/NifB/PqqE/SkfB family radical SAM enzyme